MTRSRTALLLVSLVSLGSGELAAQGSTVARTLHNLSVTGPGEIRSATETEICKFCHVPHNAVVPAPLWGHALSKVTYQTAPVARGSTGQRPAPQPDGSSRLCLSCHDGTVALGDLGSDHRRIPMSGPDRLGPDRPGFRGTDLSGSHPVSFLPDSGTPPSLDSDLGLLVPRAGPGAPRLDREGKVQCTTCHDPHSDEYYQPGRVPHFWSQPTVDGVCNGCHFAR